MFAMSSSTSISEEASVYSETTKLHDFNYSLSSLFTPQPQPQLPQNKAKKKRSQPGNPDPEAEVIALSPKSLMATNRFVCEVCSKGFQRDQNLQLHRRGHNLPWKLRQRGSKEAARKRVYVCPETSCVHHHPSRALGDLTGIKKHFSRKHGEKKWKCEKCSKRYAVQSDWKAHVKTCGTREYRCDCGNLFSRKDSFITHRAFCDALAEESARLVAAAAAAANTAASPLYHPSQHLPLVPFSSWEPLPVPNPNPNPNPNSFHVKPEEPLQSFQPPTSHLSATALLQKACTIGAMTSTWQNGSSSMEVDHVTTWQKGDPLTRDFLGVGDELPPLALEPVIAPPCVPSDPTSSFNAFVFSPATEAWGDC